MTKLCSNEVKEDLRFFKVRSYAKRKAVEIMRRNEKGKKTNRKEGNRNV